MPPVWLPAAEAPRIWANPACLKLVLPLCPGCPHVLLCGWRQSGMDSSWRPGPGEAPAEGGLRAALGWGGGREGSLGRSGRLWMPQPWA